MAVKGWIGFVAVFAGVLLAVGAGFFYWKISGNRKCEVELVSESKVIKMEGVVKKKIFYIFFLFNTQGEGGFLPGGYRVKKKAPKNQKKFFFTPPPLFDHF